MQEFTSHISYDYLYYFDLEMQKVAARWMNLVTEYEQQ
jgi:hypothetical protein